MVNANYVEVPALGVAWNMFISKNGGIFNPSAGTKAEISNGWYTYLTTVAEADTIGPVSIYVTGAGCLQQNLEYCVQQRNAGCINYTYTVTNSITLLPIANIDVWVTTDIAGVNLVWNGITDALGVAKDINGWLPCLDAGTYYFWKHEPGFINDDSPFDTEVVS
jgi:hypothetical protein